MTPPAHSDDLQPDELTPPGFGDDLKFDEHLIDTRARIARRSRSPGKQGSDAIAPGELPPPAHGVAAIAPDEPTPSAHGVAVAAPDENSKVDWSRAITTLMAASSDLKTQQALARKAGMAQSTIGRILRECVDPQSENLVRIARAFGLSLAELATVAQEGKPATEQTDISNLVERSTRVALTPTELPAPVDKAARLERASRRIEIKLANGHSVVLREKVGTKTLSRVLDVLVRL